MRLAEENIRRFGVDRDAIDGAELRTYLAQTYTLVGRRDDAIRVLEQLVDHPGGPTSAWVRLDPSFAALRSEPAFQRLVAKSR